MPRMYSVKEVHLPFLKFKGVNPILGPEMKSTGESMGIDSDPYLAFYRAQLGAKNYLPLSGVALLLGDGLDDVAALLQQAGLTVTLTQDGDNLPVLLITVTDSELLRKALERGIPIVSTIEAAHWTAKSLSAAKGAELGGSEFAGVDIHRLSGIRAYLNWGAYVEVSYSAYISKFFVFCVC